MHLQSWSRCILGLRPRISNKPFPGQSTLTRAFTLSHTSFTATMTKDHFDESDLDIFSPRAPSGYRSMKASSSQILLPLTVSNKCGQAFRWRGIKVWEPKQRFKSRYTSIDDKRSLAATFIKSETVLEEESIWEEQTEWSVCLSDRVVFLRQDEERGFLYYRTLVPASGSSLSIDAIELQTAQWLRDYLNLDVPLEMLYQEWTERDKVFARFADRFSGLRMLRQDPWECLCAFICSSNNNIARIGQMVQNLCTHFSPPLLSHTYPPCPLPGDASDELKPTSVTIKYHPFPSPETLARDGVEEKLRDLGFGYRAKYIATTAKMLCEKHRKADPGGVETRWDYGLKNEHEESDSLPLTPISTSSDPTSPRKRRRAAVMEESGAPSTPLEEESPHSVRSYLQSLRKMSYQDARQQLLQFPGIGPKVADCILLMSLDQPSSIPVDRHVFQFAERWYSIRTKKYEDIAQRFRDLWGEYAGWAHSVLFTADLRSFAMYKAGAKKEEDVKDELFSGEPMLETPQASPTKKVKTAASIDGSPSKADDDDMADASSLADRIKARRQRQQ